MPRYKFNPKNQQKESPGARSSFISSVVPEENRWNPGEGKYTIRILPPWSEEGLIAKKIMVYYKAGKDQYTFVSPEFFERDTCPFVHAHKQIRNYISGDKSGWDRHKDDIALVRPVYRWYTNVIVMNEATKGVQVWGFGKKAYEQIDSLLDVEAYGDISDPDHGTNLLLTLTPGQYGLTPIVHAVRDMSALGNMDWLDQIYDLDNIWVEPDIEEVKKAYLTTSFAVWTPAYLYADDEADLDNYTEEDQTPEEDQAEVKDTSVETNADKIIESTMEMVDDVILSTVSVDETTGEPVNISSVSSSVDEITGAPTNIPPPSVSPPTTTNLKGSPREAFDAALDLEKKVAERIAADKAVAIEIQEVE